MSQPQPSDPSNPYQAPVSDSILPPGMSTGGSIYAPCPNCQQQAANMISFSWWGGVLGPKLLTHVKCGHCGHKYNGKTGGSNALGIAIYLGVGVVIGLVAGFLFMGWQFS